MTGSRIRRTITALALGATTLAVTACGAGGSGGDMTRIDAIFDNASFVNEGQDVRVAGAVVGRVSEVSLTDDRKARLSFEVESRFTPFRQDASCTILPQSLIGEKFVECDPGRPSAGAITARDGESVPTVPLENTSSPVDLDLVVAMLGKPTNVRFQLLQNEFGAGLAARGPELSAAIRRANPALQVTRRTLAIVRRERDALGRLLTATDRILAELDARSDDLAGTFVESARFLKVTADYRAALDETLRELPPTLEELRPTLAELRDLTRDATPTLASLRRAAPSLRRLAADLGPLSDAARPAFDRLARTSRIAVPVLRRASPQLVRLREATEALAPTVPLITDLNRSLSEQGGPELLTQFIFNATMSMARFDSISHILPAHLTLTPCATVTATQGKGCAANFTEERTGNNQLSLRQQRDFERKPLADAPTGATR
ncbi:MAG: MlaD family protein [Solirubrobacteraceae bacterium]|nr:MlaD family protein [Solirubrobacteraceae bacterium]